MTESELYLKSHEKKLNQIQSIYETVVCDKLN